MSPNTTPTDHAALRGRILRLHGDAPHELIFHAYLPRAAYATDRLLVCVHGIGRQARAQAEAFSGLAETLGLVVLAPLFDQDAYARFQRPGLESGTPRSDEALDAAIAQLARASGLVDEPQRLLFGYSGGGQFAHRYAALHPERVAAVVIGAAGWYTLPEAGRRYPYGLGHREGLGDLDIEAYLRIPMAVVVGERDRQRDAALNTSPRRDREQGRTRVDRGRHFVASMRLAARARGLETPYRFVLLPRIGHSFEKAVRRGKLISRVTDFLHETGVAAHRARAIPALAPSGSASHDDGPARPDGPVLHTSTAVYAFG
ncbi:MAG: hypothetical protein R3298_04015 [Gammaproteobacteria bacterium]|nr:hypothetical protein [Gammaproteobacteria bacterium]